MINNYGLHTQSKNTRFEFENDVKEITTNIIETIQTKIRKSQEIHSTYKYIQVYITTYPDRNKILIMTLNKYL